MHLGMFPAPSSLSSLFQGPKHTSAGPICGRQLSPSFWGSRSAQVCLSQPLCCLIAEFCATWEELAVGKERHIVHNKATCGPVYPVPALFRRTTLGNVLTCHWESSPPVWCQSFLKSEIPLLDLDATLLSIFVVSMLLHHCTALTDELLSLRPWMGPIEELGSTQIYLDMTGMHNTVCYTLG